MAELTLPVPDALGGDSLFEGGDDLHVGRPIRQARAGVRDVPGRFSSLLLTLIAWAT